MVKVAAIIVTRGDQDLSPIIAGLPDWETLVWDNGQGKLWRFDEDQDSVLIDVDDLGVYGRYAAIEHTDAELIYVQDDDVIVSDPEALAKVWELHGSYPWDGRTDEPWGSDPRDFLDHVVCNMPPEFRHDFYEEHALVGFGACFHRDAPGQAFAQVVTAFATPADIDWFHRTPDIVFTALTPRVLVDVPKEDLPWAHHETRMWKQPGHQAERVRMLDLVRQVRDGA